jgi:uncharacterized protein with HEPN domain
MDSEVKAALHDVLRSMDDIQVFLGNSRDFNAYRSDRMLKAAVERKIEVIGEAINRCNALWPELPITNKRKIISTRNRVIHAYDAIDDALIWGIVINHLPRLRAEVTELLSGTTD